MNMPVSISVTFHVKPTAINVQVDPKMMLGDSSWELLDEIRSALASNGYSSVAYEKVEGIQSTVYTKDKL